MKISNVSNGFRDAISVLISKGLTEKEIWDILLSVRRAFSPGLGISGTEMSNIISKELSKQENIMIAKAKLTSYYDEHGVKWVWDGKHVYIPSTQLESISSVKVSQSLTDSEEDSKDRSEE